ncbi:FRG domain-containing protein [Herbaspirillum rhizosphaerae]|uniref:FRG domain-containing protein n=1 Tax=Herbaspirillum rhizosphaerae TaxID=346179 RepID=A0ABW8ZEW8_9BURK
MEQQQFGSIETPNGPAQLVLNIDADRRDEVMLCWNRNNDASKAKAILFNREEIQKSVHKLSPLRLFHVNPSNGLVFSPRHIEPEELQYAAGISIVLREDENSLQGEWKDLNGGQGNIKLSSVTDDNIKLVAESCNDWNEFKRWATEAREKNNAVQFRGHGSNDFKLQTTLHRAGRYRLDRYCDEIFLDFKTHAEAVMSMRFNLNDSEDFATLIGLAQHHGLPTPLLDWSSSPYIASFFAFTDAFESRSTRPDSTHVRVYALTRDYIDVASSSEVILPYFRPYISPLAITPRFNPRLYAQQGRFLVTNIGNLEQFLLTMEQKQDLKILHAADIPITCMGEALEELGYMGLTAATLFPGLDGVGRMLKYGMYFKNAPMLEPARPKTTTDRDYIFEYNEGVLDPELTPLESKKTMPPKTD